MSNLLRRCRQRTVRWRLFPLFQLLIMGYALVLTYIKGARECFSEKQIALSWAPPPIDPGLAQELMAAGSLWRLFLCCGRWGWPAGKWRLPRGWLRAISPATIDMFLWGSPGPIYQMIEDFR
jgi:hypothetical protein